MIQKNFFKPNNSNIDPPDKNRREPLLTNNQGKKLTNKGRRKTQQN
jgi:hypothetical protein